MPNIETRCGIGWGWGAIAGSGERAGAKKKCLEAPGFGLEQEASRFDVVLRQDSSLTVSRVFPSVAAFFVKSAALQLLDSFPDQPLKLLHLRGVSLHLLLIKTGLNCQNLLDILCLGDILDQRKS
jgi:hypothetical protein